MDATTLATALTRIRVELTRYVTRLTGGPDAAEDVVQTTYLRAHDALDRAPEDSAELRRWFFRIATNLALDELRRRARWQPKTVIELRELAETNADFVERSAAMVATPEVTQVVREHLDACFSCVARTLSPSQAAAVLLRELHGFSIHEAAAIVGARPTQVKHWLQAGRRTMQERYAETCALVTKRGVCHQCEELSGYFRSDSPAAVGITTGTLEERLRTLRPLNGIEIGKWHKALLTLSSRSRARDGE